jgi:hypothetical protein
MGWDFRICIHGRQEGLDSHDCPECQEIGKKLKIKKDRPDATFIFTSVRQIKALAKENKVEIDLKKL